MWAPLSISSPAKTTRTATAAPSDRWAENGEFYKDKAVRLGYAKDVLYMPNDLYIDQMREGEAEPKANKRGLWGAC